MFRTALKIVKSGNAFKTQTFILFSNIPIFQLNLAFVANLFNNYPALDEPEVEIEVIEETREEKSEEFFHLQIENPLNKTYFRSLIL